MISVKTLEKFHRTFAAIDLTAISHNLDQIRSRLHTGVKLMAVVKADAYGHGAVPVSRHIEDKVDYFAVASVEEALELRDAGLVKPILILTYTHAVWYQTMIERDITATLYNLDEARAFSDVALSCGKKAKIHVAVDTGMGRIGFAADEAGADAVKAIYELPGLELEGIFSHYACADCADKTAALEQTEVFDRFLGWLSDRGVQIPIKHICNSAASMDFDNQYDMCRVGIALYGLYPSDEVASDKFSLIPAMEVISHVVHVNDVPAGFKIGYGHTYEAPSARRIATVCIGYADGYNRCFTGIGYVLINGKKAPVVGRVCMDHLMVDVTDIDGVKVDTPVVILGEDQGAKITAEQLGEMSHSFNYEVICNFMPRVTRCYYIDGEPFEKDHFDKKS